MVERGVVGAHLHAVNVQAASHLIQLQRRHHLVIEAHLRDEGSEGSEDTGDRRTATERRRGSGRGCATIPASARAGGGRSARR